LKKFYSNGKLLITGEYLILDGALSFAVPCVYGQTLKYLKHDKPTLSWKSYDSNDSLWFESDFRNDSLEVIKTSDSETVKWIQKILKVASKISKKKLRGSISCFLDFPNNWGLGSSSTLLNNISQLFEIDPYKLHFSTTNGSGYDIACASNNTPITYQLVNKKPKFKTLNWSPNFKDDIFFVFLNKKQKSNLEIKRFNRLPKDPAVVNKISSITKKIIKSKTLDNFEKLINQHEEIIQNHIGIETIKNKYFSDYTGSIKSLGAWGGDFVMATRNDKSYFLKKGYKTIFSFKELIKTPPLKIAS
tara:strand:+ start:464 stop:1372 length:909 start_codon:yes stop_codon:yes gene_type:complete